MKMSIHKEYLDLLAKIAETVVPVASSQHAAAIVYKNQIISIGTNKKKSHPFQKKYGSNGDAIYLHSELDAIKAALKILSLEELSKSTLYVCRVKYENNKLVWGKSRPCAGCLKAIAKFNLTKVFFTEEGGQIDYL